MSFFLERNEGRHQKALQNMCNMPTTQTREREIREENISMVHVTDVKKITLMEQVADEYEQLGKEGRFSKKCIP